MRDFAFPCAGTLIPSLLSHPCTPTDALTLLPLLLLSSSHQGLPMPPGAKRHTAGPARL